MPLVAQDFGVDDDFGIDVSLGAEKELLPGLDISVEGDLRTQENSQRIERYVLGAELSYKFLNTKKFDMKVSGGFEYMWNQKMAESKLAKTPYPFFETDSEGEIIYDDLDQPVLDKNYCNYNGLLAFAHPAKLQSPRKERKAPNSLHPFPAI